MFRCTLIIGFLLTLVPQAPVLAQDRRPSLMVMPLVLEDSQGPRLWAVQAVQESLSTEAGRKQLAIIVAPPDRLEPPREAREALAVARDNRADLVLMGLCSLDDQMIRVSAQLYDVASGREIGKLQASSRIMDIIDVQADLHRQLRILVLDLPAPSVIIEAPVPAPVQAAVAEPDPGLSYRPVYDYSGFSYASPGYTYYPAYEPIYEPAYVYAPPFCSLYFGYYGGWYGQGHDNHDYHGGSEHHGWHPYDHREARRDSFNDGRTLASSNDRGPRFRDGVTTLKYGTGSQSSSHADAARNYSQTAGPRISREGSPIRTTDSARVAKSVPSSSMSEQPARSVRDTGRSVTIAREPAGPSPANRPSAARSGSDSPRDSSPSPRPSAVSRGGSDSPRASAPPPRASAPSPRESAPPRASAPAPAPAPRAPVSSSPPRGGGGGGGGGRGR